MSETSLDSAYLRIPLYKLFYIEDAESFDGLTPEEKKQFCHEYSSGEQKSILASIRWALQQPQLDIASLSPGLHHSAEAIRRYLKLIEQDLSEIIDEDRDGDG